MINKVVLSDSLRFYELGKLINPNFENCFNFDDLMASKIDAIYGYYIDKELVGFIHISSLYETTDIVNIVVDPEYRRQHIASNLLDYVLKIDGLENVMLEVRESNEAAIGLYKKYNFEIINQRKNYYGNEDALIMRRVI